MADKSKLTTLDTGLTTPIQPLPIYHCLSENPASFLAPLPARNNRLRQLGKETISRPSPDGARRLSVDMFARQLLTSVARTLDESTLSQIDSELGGVESYWTIIYLIDADHDKSTPWGWRV